MIQARDTSSFLIGRKLMTSQEIPPRQTKTSERHAHLKQKNRTIVLMSDV